MSVDTMMSHPFFQEASRDLLKKLCEQLNGAFEDIKVVRERYYFLGTKESVKRVFEQCDFAVFDVIEARNQYWPDHYLTEQLVSPWWIVVTSVGGIVIGRHKRVIAINYAGTKLRREVTADDVTKEPYLVHAHTENKMFEYLRTISNILNERIV